MVLSNSSSERCMSVLFCDIHTYTSLCVWCFMSYCPHIYSHGCAPWHVWPCHQCAQSAQSLQACSVTLAPSIYRYCLCPEAASPRPCLIYDHGTTWKVTQHHHYKSTLKSMKSKARRLGHQDSNKQPTQVPLKCANYLKLQHCKYIYISYRIQSVVVN